MLLVFDFGLMDGLAGSVLHLVIGLVYAIFGVLPSLLNNVFSMSALRSIWQIEPEAMSTPWRCGSNALRMSDAVSSAVDVNAATP